jgi:hypothetical protein
MVTEKNPFLLLLENPPMTAENGYGALHIPIEQLENQLDVFHWSTQGYQWNLFKDGYANLHVAASIELVLNFISPTGEVIKRTFVGTTNFPLLSLGSIQDWNATAKSMCIKNAATDAGKWLGRGLNSEIIPDRSVQADKSKTATKKTPDAKIMQQFLAAVEKGDQATITMLSNIYEIKTDPNAEEK